MSHLLIEQWLPLGTALVWFALTIYQITRDRFRTWTEVFFLGFTFFVGAYALSDFLFFNAEDLAWARTAALASFSTLTLAVVFFALFALVFYTRMRKEFFLLGVPALAILPILWVGLIDGFQSLHDNPASADFGTPPFVGVWNNLVYLGWVAFVLAYATIGGLAFFLTYRVTVTHERRLRGRLLGLMITFILSMALGLSTNLVRGIVGFKILPLFSTALVIPGLVAFVALSPGAKERLSVAVRRWKSRRYDIKAGFLIFEDGTLIAAKSKSGEKMVDQDLFGATIDVIQNFMRTSFPVLRGPLRSIAQGEYTIVVERARRTYLTLVLSGHDTDQLRRHMRDELREFERRNRTVLERWKGVPAEAEGPERLIASFFDESPSADTSPPFDRRDDFGAPPDPPSRPSP